MDGLLRFGTNRIRVRSWEMTTDGLTIQVDGLSGSDYNPCAQALIELGARVETARLLVELPDSQGPVMTASRSVLDASLPVWFSTRARRSRMPPATFLPFCTSPPPSRIDGGGVDGIGVARAKRGLPLH